MQTTAAKLRWTRCILFDVLTKYVRLLKSRQITVLLVFDGNRCDWCTMFVDFAVSEHEHWVYASRIP